jgi:hypothetical protein
LAAKADDNLVGDLGDLAVAGAAADLRDGGAHHLEHRTGAREGGLGAANHDGERAVHGLGRTAGDRRVQIVATEPGNALGEALGRGR